MVEDDEMTESTVTDEKSVKIPGIENMPVLTEEQYVEAMANRFEDAGYTHQQVQMMARNIKLKIRTSATKPKFDKKKARQKNKEAAKARNKNR